MSESPAAPPLARVGLCLEQESSRSFTSAPAQFMIGAVDFGGWQIHAIAAGPANFPDSDAYLLKVNYDLVLEANAPVPTWLEAGFEFLDEDVAVADAIPRGVREPIGARSYVLTAHLAFARAQEAMHDGATSDTSQRDAISVPPLDPVLDVFGIGSPRIGWRHSGTALSHSGSQARWLALLVPAGLRDLDVQASARYASTPHRLMGKRPSATPATFTVRLPTPASRFAWGISPALTVRMGFIVDVVGYSQRPEPGQYAIQQRLARLIQEVMADIGIELDENYVQNAGDGVNVFLPADADISQALPALLRTTAARLAEDNSRQHDRIRLRMAADLGPVRPAPMGFSGKTIVSFGRLVDSAQIRDAIARQPTADLAVLISDWLYDAVISQGYADLDPARFTRVQAIAKGFQADAWLWTSA